VSLLVFGLIHATPLRREIKTTTLYKWQPQGAKILYEVTGDHWGDPRVLLGRLIGSEDPNLKGEMDCDFVYLKHDITSVLVGHNIVVDPASWKTWYHTEADKHGWYGKFTVQFLSDPGQEDDPKVDPVKLVEQELRETLEVSKLSSDVKVEKGGIDTFPDQCTIKYNWQEIPRNKRFDIQHRLVGTKCLDAWFGLENQAHDLKNWIEEELEKAGSFVLPADVLPADVLPVDASKWAFSGEKEGEFVLKFQTTNYREVQHPSGVSVKVDPVEIVRKYASVLTRKKVVAKKLPKQIIMGRDI
jgi:hypothetical protein